MVRAISLTITIDVFTSLISLGIYKIYVEDFMIRDVKYISHGMSFKELESVLKKNSYLQSFPLVDKPDSMVLLGSVQRFYLVQLVDNQIGREKRLQVHRR